MRSAFDVYLHRLVRTAAAMTAAVEGLDLLVLTGGVGEHSWEVRAGLAEGLDHVGIAVDAERNRTTIGDGEINAPWAGARTVVVTAREDLEIRRQMHDVLDNTESRSGQ